MTKIILSVLLSIFALSGFAPNKVVENFYLSTAYNIRYNLSKYIFSCTFDLDRCGLSIDDQRVLQKISSVVRSYSDSTEIEFSNDQKSLTLVTEHTELLLQV